MDSAALRATHKKLASFLLIALSSKIVGLPMSGIHVATVVKRLFEVMRPWIET